MKKIKYLVVVLILLLNTTTVSALTSTSKYQANQPLTNTLSEGIVENIDIKANGRIIDYVDLTYTIPVNYDKNIKIVSKVFDALAATPNYVPSDGVKINLSIINNSNNKYLYQDKSIILSTEDLSNYDLEDSKEAVGFNNRVVKKVEAPARTANSAIQFLYNVSSTSKIKKAMIEDEAIDVKLKEKGYSGISDLDKYYLDYYNSKYGLMVNKLEDFSFDIISELFNGNYLGIKESNPYVVELGYNYWYNKLLSFSFLNDECTDFNSEEFSIGSYMRNNERLNNYFNNDIGIIDKNTIKNLTPAYLKINGYYTTNAFMNYNFSGYLEFNLIKEEINEIPVNDIIVEEETTLKEGEIIPPYTGIK